MSPRKSKKAFNGKITTPPPSWLSETESDLKPADSELVKLSDIHLPASQPRRYFASSSLTRTSSLDLTSRYLTAFITASSQPRRI